MTSPSNLFAPGLTDDPIHPFCIPARTKPFDHPSLSSPTLATPGRLPTPGEPVSSVFAKPKYLARAYPYSFTGDLLVRTLAGGTPSDPNVAEGWLRSKLADRDDLIREAVADTMVERGVNAEEAAQIVTMNKHLNGFKRDTNGLYIEGRQLKACLKEAASICWPYQRGATNATKAPPKGPRVWGPSGKSTLQWFPEHLFVVEDRLPLGVEQPTGVMQRFIHSFRGNGIQYEEYVEDATISFRVITDHEFKAEEWAMLWLTAEQQGLGASRSQGFGRFEVTRWEAA